MKKPLDIRIKDYFIKFGKKNKFYKRLALLCLILTIFIFNLCKHIRLNSKRISMLVMIFLLFAVYTSFSFPIFEAETNTGVLQLNVALEEDAQTATLAKDEEINMNDIEILDDDEIFEGYVDAELHGIEDVDQYDLEEILDYHKDSLVQTETTSDSEIESSTDTIVFSADDWKLLLINKQHPVPDDYTFTLGTIKDSMQCDERIIDDLMNMLQSAKEEGVNLVICSPYRDMERQEVLFDKKIQIYMNKGMSYMEAYKVASQSVTVPGASEHQVGLALDIVCNTYKELDTGFGETEAGIWLAENSARFGFILRYPEGKEYITGIQYEPWHFRYVGVDAAEIITKQGMTLEEFVEGIK